MWAATGASARRGSRPSCATPPRTGSSYPYLSPGAQRALHEAALGGYDRAGGLGAYGDDRGDRWAGPRRESIMMMGGGGGGMGTLQALLSELSGLFRKLRKLSLRYGGVVAFFDEADALGNRGAGVGGDGGFGSERLAAFLRDATEAGSSYPYLSPGAQRALHEAALGGYDRAGGLGAYGDDRGDRWAGPRRESIMMMGGGGGGMGRCWASRSLGGSSTGSCARCWACGPSRPRSTGSW